MRTIKQPKLPYVNPQTELARFEPLELLAQSPDPLTLPGTIVDPFITP